MIIRLTMTLEVDGKALHVQNDALTTGDFTTGFGHLLQEYVTPMAELVYTQMYPQLTSEISRAQLEAIEERESISRRLARLGMV